MPNHVIDNASPELIALAAQSRGWQNVLRQLGLAMTDDNIRAFRIRALELGVPIAHLRRPFGFEGIPSEVFREAVAGATSAAQVLARLGMRPGGATYEALERAAIKHGVQLPPRRRHGAARAQSYRRTDDEVRAAFRDARSIADLLRRLGLVPRGENYRVIKDRLQSLGLDPAELPGQRWAHGLTFGRTPLEEMLVRGRSCSGANLAKRLLAAGLVSRRCDKCGLTEWLGDPIPLELDHINGEHDDNRLVNLRLLCPNCHACTETYRGRNIPRRRTLVPPPEC
jgi:hypothetical protein